MSSIIKVDQIQLSDGSTPSLSNLGITDPTDGLVTGKVLQIVTVNSTNQQSITSTSFATTDMSVSITPSSTSSKILAIGTTSLRNNTNGFTAISLYRGDTNLGAGNGMAYSKDFGTQWRGSAAFNYLDSPNTTSSVTYTIRCRIQESGHTGYVNAEGAQGTLTLLEIAG